MFATLSGYFVNRLPACFMSRLHVLHLRFQIFDLLHHRRIWSNRLNKQNVVSIDDNAIWRMPLLPSFYQDVDCLLGLLVDTHSYQLNGANAG